MPDYFPNQREALITLNALPGIGPVAVRKLRDAFGGPQADYAVEALRAPPAILRAAGLPEESCRTIGRWRDLFDPQRELDLAARHAVSIWTVEDQEYPALLQEIYDPPPVLYAKGPARLDRPAVAVVGTRHPTQYGRSVARSIARQLVLRNFSVVSGMARGIDTEAHRETLQSGGVTAAVLGCGIDLIYPPENIDLYHELSAKGLLLSEYPFGEKAGKQTFPRRNRVVAGICQAIVVVESGENGGSMITARFAGEQGRTVLAVPGRIDQPSSGGCHQLIRDGAILLGKVEDLFEELRYDRPDQTELSLDPAPSPASPAALATGLEGDLKTVWEVLSEGDILTPDAIAGRLGWGGGRIAGALLLLELRGLIAKRMDGHYERRS